MSTPDGAPKPKISFSFGGAAKKPGASPAAAAGPSASSSTKPFALPKPKTAAPVKPPTAFALAADDDEPAPAPVAESSKSGRSWGKPKADPKALVHQAVKPSRAIRERQEEALELDQRAFAYDEVWDSMKDAEKAAKQRREDESSDRKPKYMHQAIASAATRKLDQIRAQEKMLERERALEGDEFADKEKFVTQAYKDQMEAVRKAEEEEQKREEELKKTSKGGISAFYSSYLDRSSQAHEAAVAASLAAAAAPPPPTNLTIQRPVQGPAAPPPAAVDDSATRDGDQQAIKEALDRGLAVELNDSGEVVDERSLLTPGLNILPKRAPPPPPPGASARGADGSSKPAGFVASRRVGEASSAREIKARTDALLRSQFAEEQERQRRLEQERDAAREVGVKEKRNDDAAVGSARQRFEERKRRKLEEEQAAREQAAASAAAGQGS